MDDDEPFTRKANTPDDLDCTEFDANSRWPRRLLHVPSMTSHKWRPGNTYNDITNPEYSVISYTWGRWRIRDPLSKVKALEIKDVPWDIPRVDSGHFTAEQFRQILLLVVQLTQKVKISTESSPFVWVDVGCIPQWRNSAVADSEIGRQSRIFRGASYAFVWLTTADPTDLWEIYGRIRDGESFDVLEDLKALRRLLDDPWFESTWTLQESFIQAGAHVLTSTGFSADLSQTGLMTLHGLRWFARRAVQELQTRNHVEGCTPEFVADFLTALLRAGFNSSMSSPMETLACAQLRTASDELDRIYGIMQIFGDEFRVGKARAVTNPSQAATNHSFTLVELEDELGKLIIEKKTLLSQAFWHTEPPLAGTSWRICGSARAISVELMAALSEKNNEEIARPHCILSTCFRNSITWATFKGKTCRFEEILSCLKPLIVSTYIEVYLDAGLDHPSLDEDVDTVVKHFGSETLMLLWVSSVSTGDVHYGLLLLKPGPEALAVHKTRRGWHAGLDITGLQAWARVGICSIYCEFENHTDLFEVTSDIWMEQEEIQIWG